METILSNIAVSIDIHLCLQGGMGIKKIVWLVTISCLVFSIYTLWQITNSRTFQFFGELVARVNTTDKVVALTFDDGPSPKAKEVLDILEDNGVKATFFVIGNELERNMLEGKRIAAAGHELGNHTYSHQRMVFKSPAFIKEEIEKTDALIRQTGYQGEIHFRPPNGKKLLVLPYYLSRHHRNTITWDIEPDSFPEIAGRTNQIVHYVVQNTRPGSIILLHVMYDSRQESFEAIQGIVNGLKAKGYSFKTVSELLEYQK